MDAYEIRLELLKLAQSIEGERVNAERNRLEQNWHSNRERGLIESYPTLPEVTHNDVISVAEQLNRFVSFKG